MCAIGGQYDGHLPGFVGLITGFVCCCNMFCLLVEINILLLCCEIMGNTGPQETSILAHK